MSDTPLLQEPATTTLEQENAKDTAPIDAPRLNGITLVMVGVVGAIFICHQSIELTLPLLLVLDLVSLLAVIFGIVRLARILLQHDPRALLKRVMRCLIFITGSAVTPFVFYSVFEQPYIDRVKASAQQASVHAIQNAIEIFAADTGYYPAHLTDLTQTDPTKARGVLPNASGQGGAPGVPFTAKSNYHGPYFKTIPGNPTTQGNVEGTDYLYNNQTGKITPVKPDE